MYFELVKAAPEDADALFGIMDTVDKGMEHPEWFVSDDLDYIKAHIGSPVWQPSDQGFIIKAVAHEGERSEIAGMFMVAFPGITEKNLGHHIQLGREELLKVAHMDSVAILPKYRGHGLQYDLICKAEEVIRRETNYRILMATVHPENVYSLHNVQKLEYDVVAEAVKYGGYYRYVLLKEIDDNGRKVDR